MGEISSRSTAGFEMEPLKEFRFKYLNASVCMWVFAGEPGQ